MRGPRIEVTGPLAPHASGFQAELRRLGYTASPAKKHRYLMARLSCWLEVEGLDIADGATSRVEPFFTARRSHAGQWPVCDHSSPAAGPRPWS